MRAALATAAALATVALPAGALAQDPTGVPPPNLLRGVATSQTTVDLQFNEAVDPASVQPGDFVLEMTEATRTMSSAVVSGDGMRVTLTSTTPWDPGTAGRAHLIGPGVVADRIGLTNSTTDWVTVGAAPGDFIAPVVSRFHLTKTRGLCWTYNVRRCPHPGAAWVYRVTEDGDAYITVHRGRRLIGVRRYNGQPGSNFINFDGKIGGRRIGPGRYTAQIGVQDDVGNRTPEAQQPKARFSVKRR
jgi:hypothetical protein